MRTAGLPISDLQRYVALVEQGEQTIPERLDLLMEHRDTLRAQIAQLQLALAATEYKIATYGGATQP
jgi:DNA-binding transcriptional MerR regulator